MRFALLSALALFACSSTSSPNASSSGGTSSGTMPRTPALLAIQTLAGEKKALTSVHEPLKVVVSGLTRSEQITITVDLGLYQSKATMTADTQGTVDTSTAVSMDGTYTGVDPEGLSWSMRAPPQEPYPDDKSIKVTLTRDDGSTMMAEQKRVFAQDVITRELSSNGLAGTLFIPQKPQGKAAILVLGGSEGGHFFSSLDARLLAELGYPALALGYFGEGSLPATLERVPLEYFEEARAWLAKQSETQGRSIGLYGTSRGGELVLRLGATSDAFKFVIANVPSGYLWAGLGTPNTAAWMQAGQDLPFIPASGTVPGTTKDDQGRIAFQLTTSFRDAVAKATPTQKEQASSAVEKTAGPILLIGGADDQLWPSCELMKVAEDRLKRAPRAFKDESVCLENSGHTGLLFLAGLPTRDWRFTTIGTQRYAYGGTPQGIAKGARKARETVAAFLSKL
jgi:dienelactone hydrolase